MALMRDALWQWQTSQWQMSLPSSWPAPLPSPVHWLLRVCQPGSHCQPPRARRCPSPTSQQSGWSVDGGWSVSPLQEGTPVPNPALETLTPPILTSGSPFAACFCEYAPFLHFFTEKWKRLQPKILPKQLGQPRGDSPFDTEVPHPVFTSDNRWLLATLFLLRCDWYLSLAGCFLCSWEPLSRPCCHPPCLGLAPLSVILIFLVAFLVQ